ncbi:MAG: ATP-dependent Clp protease ATP-binding subunit [Kofleriaceae bacterium]|nr:ATP-dependent Clp protease ATP-binding subunit [Kofleriaceae bacterium]
MSDTKLEFTTLALRRTMASDYAELSPIVAPQVTAYGSEDWTRTELSLALSELPDEARPATVARLVFPDGVRLEEVEVEFARTELQGRLARPQKATITVVVVPEPRAEAPEPSGHWVFVPVIDHACYVSTKEDLKKRLAKELSVLPAALALELDGWKRLMTWTPTSLEPLEVELVTTPLAQAQGRKALADAERKRQARATLESAARLVKPVSDPPPLVGRGELLDELSRVLEHRGKRSILLVGDEAAGKSALVEAWVTQHPQRQVWATSASELVAGASGLGEWQQRVANVLAAAETLGAILYFDDFGALFADRPAEGGVDIGAAIRRHVVDGRVCVIGELTAVALDRAERQDVSLIGSMLRVHVPPTDPATTIEACKAWAQYWLNTQPQRPQIAPAMVPTAVDLARRYLPYRAFPGKAVRLLEELRVAHDASRDESGAGRMLGDADLYAAFSWATGIPIQLLDETRSIAADDVVTQLRRRMVGQDAAVRRVAEAICVAKARLAPADKPLASLLFVGPSGVGKTELARSVAAYLFGTPDKMVRLDMSEYTDPWAAERLFGGTSGEDGRLTAAVKSQPFGVVLLDEIEKAHPSVFDLLLQVLGEARLTDGRGRTTYFHNSLIVLTSNLGTRSAKGRLGLGPDEPERDREDRRYRDAVLAAFRPELVNRLDQIVVFHPLEPAEIAKVADIAIARLAERRGLTQSGVLLDISPAALARLAETGFSAELGARALRRHLDASLLAPAARLLARAGADGHGGTLTVRTPDEEVQRDKGARIAVHEGDVHVALWRRAASTGKRMVRSALALGELRRDTDRELARPGATAVRDRIGELEATLATAAHKKDGKSGLPGSEIARLSTDHARLSALWTTCASAQGELRTAEELCLEALAKDIDAVDLIDSAIAQRQKFRRDLFWLLVGMRPQRPGITMLVHTPDARPALFAWVKLVLEAASHHGWRGSVHLWGEQQAGWKPPWGPPHDRAWAEKSLVAAGPTAALVRIAGTGADLLFGLEAGLHRFVGLAGEPCHVWVDLLEPKTEFTDEEWQVLPPPPQPRAARGTPMREVTIGANRVTTAGEEVDPTWTELPRRLAEAAVTRLLSALDHKGHNCRYDEDDKLWVYDNPLSALTQGDKP